MANVTFPWNPWQDQILGRVENEVLKTSTENSRRIYVPRAAPFFLKNCNLRLRGSTTPLNPGSDYLFCHTFDRFTRKYKRNVFSAIVLRKDYTDQEILISYDTIGGPFVLDEVAYVDFVANIANKPREADWDDLFNLPTEWPADPHDHPPVQVYDMEDMYLGLKQLILVMSDTSANGTNALALLEEHLEKNILQAHPGSKVDLGLPDVANLRPSVLGDIGSNNAGVAVTMDVLAEMFRRAANGTLNLS